MMTAPQGPPRFLSSSRALTRLVCLCLPQKEGHSLSGRTSPRTLWKPGVPQKTCRPPEGQDGSGHVPSRAQGGGSAGAPGSPAATPEDEGSFQTVWATVFEHRVERRLVADLSGHRLPATLPRTGAEPRVPEPRPKPEKGPWPAAMAPRKETPGGAESPEPGRLGRAALAEGEPRPCHTPVLEKSPFGDRRSPPAWQRVEPRYDVVLAVGERAHSEAVTTAPEAKAVTLRSSRTRPSLKDQQLSQEATSADLERSPRGPLGCVQRASLTWEAQGQEASWSPVSREPKDMAGGNCLSPRWTGGTLASLHRATVGVSREPCAPEATPARAVRAAAREAQGPEGVRSGSEGCVSGAGEGPPQGPPARTKDKAWGSPAQPRPETQPVQKGPLVAANTGDPRLAQVPEAKVWRTSPATRRVDRWRRRTLPQDVKFDEFSLLAPEDTSRAEQRGTDYLSPTAGALQNPPAPPTRAETQEAAPGPRRDWDRASPAVKPGSSAEPRATFFAVTYQIPDIQKAKSVVKPGPENSLGQSRKPAPLPSPHPLTAPWVSPNHEEPPAPAGSRSWAKGAEHVEVTDTSRAPEPTDHPWPARDGTLGRSRERIIDVDALWTPRGPGDGGGLQSSWKDSGNRMPHTTPALRTRPKASSLLLRRKTEVVSETYPGKMRDGYRSSVLDIDALMAQYREQGPQGPGEAQGGGGSPTTESGSSPLERPSRPAGPECGSRSPLEAAGAEGPRKRASLAEPIRTSSPGSARPPAETPGPAPATKPSAPLWALPLSAPAENCPATSAVPEGPGHTVVGLTENESKASVSQPRAKCPHYPAEPRPSAREDPATGVRASPKSPPADRKKRTPRKSTGQEEGGEASGSSSPRPCGSLPPDVRRSCSEKGPRSGTQEGLSLMQEARERRQEQPRGRLSLPVESSEAKAGPRRWEPRTQDSHKVSPEAVLVER